MSELRREKVLQVEGAGGQPRRQVQGGTATRGQIQKGLLRIGISTYRQREASGGL